MNENPTEAQNIMVSKAKRFIEWLADDKDIRILLPVNVVAEFLCFIPYEQHNKIMSVFNESFIIAPFDVAAASCLAKIYHQKKNDGTIEQMRQDGVQRKAITFDCQIVSIALTHNATVIYSHDKDLSKYFRDYIQVEEMPEMPR
ncbi:MAG: PIN domain-containing protein [Nitrospirae bacterium]|nr:PIN domain-containing protein [Nitrospirota bacterium]